MNSLQKLLGDYLQREQSRRLGRLTLRSREYHIAVFLHWLRSRSVLEAEQLHASHLENWQQKVTGAMTPRGLPLKPRSINKYLDSVRGFLRHLAREGLLPDSFPTALASVREPRVLPCSVLDHDQVQRLLSRLDTTTTVGIRDAALLELAYSSGLRAAEILGLDVQDIHWTQGTARVMGKGSKERIVPVGQTAQARLETYLQRARPFLLTGPAQNALFLDRRGNRLPYHTLRRLVHHHARDLDFTVPVTPHTFRRSCTTELIRAGANLYHVKDLLGHESLETLKHYTRLTIQDLKATHARCHPREHDSPDNTTGLAPSPPGD
jgi:integrase/recombinase XerD